MISGSSPEGRALDYKELHLFVAPYFFARTKNRSKRFLVSILTRLCSLRNCIETNLVLSRRIKFASNQLN
jgi:hypothetical protein